MSDYSQAIPLLDAARPSRTATGGVSRLAALALPSFGVAVFAVAVLQVLFLSQGAQGLFRDSDTGWHIRNGEAMLRTFAVPRVDSFSYTRNGSEWFAWEWLSDVALGGAHRVAGLSGVALLAGFAVALTVWGAARLSLSLGGNLFLTALSSVLLLGASSIHWLARPHVFSWALSLLFLGIVEHERRKPSNAIYLLPVLACLWANVHGSFLLGPAILFIYAVAEWINRRFAVACLASLAATFINPYGWHLHDHVFTYLNNTYLMDHIAEFRSFSFHSAGALYVELFFFVAVLGTIALLKQRAFAPALLALGLLHISLYAARHIPTAAVLLLPLCVAALSKEAEEWLGLLPLLEYSKRLRAIDSKVWGLIPAALVVIMAVVSLGNVGFDPAVFPIRAVDYMEQHGLDGRVFAKDQWSGYLIYRFAGQTKVFVDGRSDFYGQGLMETYGQVMDVKPGWDSTLKQYDVRYVLIPSDHALAAALQLSPDWKRVYADSVAVIFSAAERRKSVAPGVSPGFSDARAMSAVGAADSRESFAPTGLIRGLTSTPGSRPGLHSFAASRLLIVLVLVAAISDLRSRRIPNWLTVAGAAAGVVLSIWNGGLWGGVTSLAGAALGLGIFIPLYMLGGMGAGDVKLFGAVGALTGPQPLLIIFVFTGLLGGIAAIALSIVRGRLRETLERTGSLMLGVRTAATPDSLRLPYGAVIAGGTLLSLLVLH